MTAFKGKYTAIKSICKQAAFPLQICICFARFKIMKISENQAEKLALMLVRDFKKISYFRLDEKENIIREKIKAVFLKNQKDEEALDRDVKRMMEAYSSQIDAGQVDSRKLFGMIKGKLAKEQGFIL